MSKKPNLKSKLSALRSKGYITEDEYKQLKVAVDHKPVLYVNKANWISVDEPPKENGRYFVTVDYGTLRVVDIASYAKNLYEIDEYEFADFKDIGGWYNYDPEYGYYEISTVVAWRLMFKPWGGDNK